MCIRDRQKISFLGRNRRGSALRSIEFPGRLEPDVAKLVALRRSLRRKPELQEHLGAVAWIRRHFRHDSSVCTHCFVNIAPYGHGPPSRIGAAGPAPALLRAYEGEDVGVEGVGIDLGEAMAAALINLQLRTLTIFAVFSPEAEIGTIWSSSPWMTSVGLSIFLRSAV